jgi:serpin B
MHRIFAVSFLFVCLFTLSAENDRAQVKEFMSQPTLSLATNNNEFAFNLYNELQSTDGNICFSPYSISSALAMVYDGAREETRKQMGSVLKFDNLPQTLNESFSALNRFFAKISTDVNPDFRLFIANSLWIQTGTPILPEFMDNMARYFKVNVHRVDFFKQKESTRREINQFVKEKTMGKIVDLIAQNDIQEFTKMVLVSSIYMKAKWLIPFEQSLTKMEPFFTSKSATITQPMMNETAYFPYFKGDNFSAVQLAYIHPKDNLPELKFLVLLPSENFGLKDVEKKLNVEFFNSIISGLESENVNLYMPKFSFSKGFALKDMLVKLGMVLSFETEANFEGITGSKDLQIGQVSHKAFIAIDETGTEAAAATAVNMNTKAILHEKEPIIFRMDHPFLFVIYEKLTGSILFCGRMVNPLE